MKTGYVALIGAVILLIIAAVYIFINTDNSSKTVKIEKKRFIKSVYASGYVDSVNKVVVKPEVSGYLEEIYVKERDKVRKNQVIAVIANKKLNDNLREIRVKKELVERRLKEDSNYLKALKDEIDIQKLNMDIENKNLKRRVELFEKGIISKESYEQAEKSYEVAEKSYRRSIETYNDKADSLETEFESLRAQEDAMLEEIERHTIKSPSDGEILRKLVEEGDYINHLASENELFSIGDTKNLETVLSVDEEFMPLVKLGQKVVITTDAYPDEVFEGRVTEMERESDRKSRTVIVKADVSYPESIPVGVTVEANIILDDRDGLFITEDSYKDGYVDVVEGNKTQRVPVKTGVRQDKYIEIVEGIEEDQEILTR